MKIRWVVAAAWAALLVRAVPVVAHHSFVAQYDATKPIDMRGVVSKIDWTNPHARFYVDVKNEKGEVATWNFELASPNVLVRNGWKRDTLKIGDHITVSGYLGRSGERMAIAMTLIAADGRPLFGTAASEVAR